jgi:hypothetical protein
MKFFSVFTIDPSAPPAPPDPQMYAAMGALIKELMDLGKMLDTGGVMPTGVSVRVSRAKGSTSVTDGPFAEAKEIVGGLALFDVASKAEAAALTERFLALVGSGTCTLYEVSPTPTQRE